MDEDDENDLLAIRITAAGDTTELERDYADDLEDLVALSVAQQLGQKRSRLPKLQLQPAAAESATGLHPKSPSLYASPRAPSVSANQQGWETLQAGTTPPASSEPLSAAVPAALLPRPSQRRIESERSTRIPGKRKTATAEQRSASQPPAARVRPAAARVDLSQIPPATATTSSSSRPRLTSATDLPSRLPTPRRRVPSQGPIRSFSPRTGTAENPTKHAVTTTDLEPEEIASSQTTTTAIRATTTTRQTPASSGGRAGPLKGEEPTAAGTRRLPARPTTARVSTSRRTVSTSRMRTKSAPWPAGGGDESNEPLPPWFDDSGPRIYRSSEGKLTFAGLDPGHPPPSSAAASSATGSLPLHHHHHHRPQDRVLPAVAKRIQAERLKQLQAADPGLGDAWLVSEWGVMGDPRRAISVPMKTLKAERDSSTTPTSNAAVAATVLPQLSSHVADSKSTPTEAVVPQPDPPEPPGGDFAAATAECTTTTSSSSPPRRPPTEEGDSSLGVALAEHGKPCYEPEQVIPAARAAGNHHQTARLQTGLGRGSSSPPSSAVGRADSRYSSVMNTAQDDESQARTADPKSPGCCASCVIS